jgi:hypothetical protein
MIYFPRPEHVIIRYGEHKNDIHYAVAIPKGEGRYVLKTLKKLFPRVAKKEEIFA